MLLFHRLGTVVATPAINLVFRTYALCLPSPALARGVGDINMAIRWLVEDRVSGEILGGLEGIPQPRTPVERDKLKSIISNFSKLGEVFAEAVEERRQKDIERAWRKHDREARELEHAAT